MEINQVEADEIQDRLLLSTIQKIKTLSPIPGKDRVEKVEFESVGYTAICEKGLHKEGDLVLFTKYDTVVANIPMFSWMADFKFRVKPKSFTIKNDDDVVIGKIYSQGIVIPQTTITDWFMSDDCVVSGEVTFEEGLDLTEELGTKKYIPAVKQGGMGNMQSKGDFPSHIVSKTDEMNLASKMKYVEFFKGHKVVARMKMEGSSLTAYLDPNDGELNVCSRNNNLKEQDGNKFWFAANKNEMRDVLSLYPEFAVQAELMGPGIQNNKLQLTEPDMYVFTLTDIKNKQRLGDEALSNFCWMTKMKIAPLVETWNDFDLTFDQLQEIADKLEYLPGVPAEGMVIRPATPVWCDKLQDWLSMKIINRNYQL